MDHVIDRLGSEGKACLHGDGQKAGEELGTRDSAVLMLGVHHPEEVGLGGAVSIYTEGPVSKSSRIW